MILVVGATGPLGSEICRSLRAAGQPVCGLVRASSGREKVEQLQAARVAAVIADLKDSDSIGSGERPLAWVSYRELAGFAVDSLDETLRILQRKLRIVRGYTVVAGRAA